MEIGSLRHDDFEVWMPFMDAEVCVRYVPLEELREIGREATTLSWDGNHRKTEAVDAALANRLMGRAAIRGWRGITMEGEEYPYTPENCDFLMSRWTDFAKFAGETALNLQALVEEERRRKAKNSVLTSGRE